MPRNWMRDEPTLDAEESAQDTRPILDVCPICGRDVHGGDEYYEPDDAYCFEGEYVHQECVFQYLKENGYKV